MPKTSTFFWTDSEQAQQRLQGTTVLYNDEPTYISEIRQGREDDVPRAVCYIPSEGNAAKIKRLDSPLFGRFRELPKLGWMNSKGLGRGVYPVFTERLSRNSRTHGLNDNNVRVSCFQGDVNGQEYSVAAGRFNFENIRQDKGFIDCHQGRYPSLAATLENIEAGQGIAYSRNFLVYRDQLGLRWLYRKTERVGVFTGNDTLNLISKYSYYREEVLEDPAFTLNNVREF